jgi:hypothetical protein
MQSEVRFLARRFIASGFAGAMFNPEEPATLSTRKTLAGIHPKTIHPGSSVQKDCV